MSLKSKNENIQILKNLITKNSGLKKYLSNYRLKNHALKTLIVI